MTTSELLSQLNRVSDEVPFLNLEWSKLKSAIAGAKQQLEVLHQDKVKLAETLTTIEEKYATIESDKTRPDYASQLNAVREARREIQTDVKSVDFQIANVITEEKRYESSMEFIKKRLESLMQKSRIILNTLSEGANPELQTRIRQSLDAVTSAESAIS